MSAAPSVPGDSRRRRPSRDFYDGEGGATRLMHDMGTRRGYNPVPRDHGGGPNTWYAAEGEPDHIRLFGWLLQHTVEHGHRSPFAISGEGHPLGIEHAGEYLGMDDANVRRAWRKLVRKRVARNGTPSEGPRKMFLCADVVPVPTGEEEGEEKVKEVCTDLLPSYAEKIVRGWPAEQREACIADFKIEDRIEDEVVADGVAVARLICSSRKDSLFSRWKLPKIHLKGKEPDEAERARQARRNTILDAMEKLVSAVADAVAAEAAEEKGSVQTVSDFVQNSDSGVYEKGGEDCTRPLSLLPQRTTRESQIYSKPSEPLPNEVHKFLPAPEDVKAITQALQTAWGSPLAEEADEAIELLRIAKNWKPEIPVLALCEWIRDFGRLKQAAGYYIASPKLWVHVAPEQLGPWIKANLVLVRAIENEARAEQRRREHDRRMECAETLLQNIPAWSKLLPGAAGDVVEIDRHFDAVMEIVEAIGPSDSLAFAAHVTGRLKGMDQKALAKAPGRPPGAPAGPRILGLLYELAVQWSKQGGRR